MPEPHPSSRFDDLLGDILDLSDGPARAARLRELERDEPILAAQLAKIVQAYEEPSFVDHPEIWTLSEHWFSVPDRAGEWFGGWQVIGILASGGMGDVYEAVKTVEGVARRGALKVAQRRIFNKDDRSRFITELLALSKVTGHPNVVQLIEGDVTQDGQRFLVMELVQGCTLTEWAQQEQLGTAARVELFQQLLEALAWVHNKGRVHRDIKPENVLVREGYVKLVDFGLASEIDGESGERAPSAFTWRWASPEQRQGKTPGTPKSDQYSAVLVLRDLLTGNPASAEKQGDAELSIRVEDLPSAPSSELGKDLNAIIAKALSLEPENRYETVSRLHEDLKRYIRHEPVSALPSTLVYRIRKFTQRELIASKVFIALVAAIILAVFFWWQTGLNRDRAERRAQAVSDLTRLVLERSLHELENLPGTLRIRDLMVRSVEDSLNRLKVDAKVNTQLAVTLARAHLSMAAMSSVTKGPTETERNEAIRHCVEALRLLQSLGGPRGTIEVQDLTALSFARRAQWVNADESLNWRKQAVELRRVLANETHNDWKRRQDLADALKDLADSEFALGRLAQAWSIVEETQKLRQQLARERPGDTDAIRQVAKIEATRGFYSGLAGKTKDAMNSFERAAALFRTVAQKEVGKKADLDLANARAWEAQGLQQAGRKREAADAAGEVVAIRKRYLRSDPDDVTLTTDYADALNKACVYKTADGDFGGAETSGQEAITLLIQVFRSGRGGPPVSLMMGQTWSCLAGVAEAQLERAEALNRYEEAKGQYRKWIADSGARLDGALQLGQVLNKIAALNWILSQTRVSEPPMLSLIHPFEQTAAADPYLELHKEMAWAVLAQGQTEAGALTEARVSLERARAVSRQLISRGGSASLYYYWYSVRTLLIVAILEQSGKPSEAFTTLKECRTFAAKATELDPSDLDNTTLQAQIEDRAALLASKLGKSKDSAKALNDARLFVYHAAQQSGSVFPIPLLQQAIASEAQVVLARGDITDFQRQIENWSRWLDKEGLAAIGPRARLMSLQVSLWEHQYSLQFGDTRNLEDVGLQIIAKAQMLRTAGVNEDELDAVSAGGAFLAAAGRAVAANSKDDAKANAYLRRADQYSRAIQHHMEGSSQNAALLLSTFPFRMMAIEGVSPARALNGMDQEVRRWEELWRTDGPTQAGRYGLALALVTRSAYERSDDDHPSAKEDLASLRDLTKAEAALKPLRATALDSPLSWLVWGSSFEVAEFYSDSGQPMKAMEQLKSMMAWLKGSSVMPVLFRAITLEELATLQEDYGAPEETARLMELHVGYLQDLIHDGAWKLEAPAPSITSWGTYSGQTGLSIAFGHLLQRLGAYRMVQAGSTRDNASAAVLFHRAAEMFRKLVSFMDSTEDKSLLEDFPTKKQVEVMIEYCDGYGTGQRPKQPGFANPIQ